MRYERAKTFLWKIQSLVGDYRLGISTRGVYGVESEITARYMTLPYSTTASILRRLDPGPADSFLDIGCGKGRMLCCAARLELRKVTGVEYSQELCEIAERNASRLRGARTPISVVNKPAQEFDYDDADVLYFYNPFGPPILDEVLRRIEHSLEGRPRPARLVYANPLHEQSFKVCSWLEQYDELDPDHDDSMAVRVSFWRSKVASR